MKTTPTIEKLVQKLLEELGANPENHVEIFAKLKRIAQTFTIPQAVTPLIEFHKKHRKTELEVIDLLTEIVRKTPTDNAIAWLIDNAYSNAGELNMMVSMEVNHGVFLDDDRMDKILKKAKKLVEAFEACGIACLPKLAEIIFEGSSIYRERFKEIFLKVAEKIAAEDLIPYVNKLLNSGEKDKILAALELLDINGIDVSGVQSIHGQKLDPPSKWGDKLKPEERAEVMREMAGIYAKQIKKLNSDMERAQLGRGVLSRGSPKPPSNRAFREARRVYA